MNVTVILCMIFSVYLVFLAVMLFVVFFLALVLTCADSVSFSSIPVQEQDLIIPCLTFLSYILLPFVSVTLCSFCILLSMLSLE